MSGSAIAGGGSTFGHFSVVSGLSRMASFSGGSSSVPNVAEHPQKLDRANSITENGMKTFCVSNAVCIAAYARWVQGIRKILL